MTSWTWPLVLGVEVQRKAVQGASVGEEVAIALKDVDGLFPFGGDVVRGCQ